MESSNGSAFRQLIVWQKSMLLAYDVYQATKRLPKDELFGMISQLRRCAVSIPSNIAEGSKRGTKKDFAHFLRIANGSAAELETQLLLADKLYQIANKSNLFSLLVEVQKMLESLIRKV